jgi:hypothetical protein
MMVHVLKSWPEFFEPVLLGVKTAELRYNDRRYEAGDVLVMREWEPSRSVFTGRECARRVTHVLHGVGTVGAIAPLRGLSANYVLLSMREIEYVISP